MSLWNKLLYLASIELNWQTLPQPLTSWWYNLRQLQQQYESNHNCHTDMLLQDSQIMKRSFWTAGYFIWASISSLQIDRYMMVWVHDHQTLKSKSIKNLAWILYNIYTLPSLFWAYSWLLPQHVKLNGIAQTLTYLETCFRMNSPCIVNSPWKCLPGCQSSDISCTTQAVGSR